MNYAALKMYDTANGPGVRISLFVSGCEHHCKECFNSEAWDFNYGKEYTIETVKEIISGLTKPWITGISILGGEPMHPRNVSEVAKLVYRIKCNFPEKTIWVYSGYTVEELMERYMNAYIDPKIDQEVGIDTGTILRNIDVLVDGKFEIEKKDLKLRFKGSSNQRIIGMPEFIASGKINEPVLPE